MCVATNPQRPQVALSLLRDLREPRALRVRAVLRQRTALTVRHPASGIGAAGDTACNAEGAGLSEVAEKVFGPSAGFGPGSAVLTTAAGESLRQLHQITGT